MEKTGSYILLKTDLTPNQLSRLKRKKERKKEKIQLFEQRFEHF